MSDTFLMQDDLRALLDALGMFSGARPQSPHEVMWEAILEVRRLRKRCEELEMALRYIRQQAHGVLTEEGQ